MEVRYQLDASVALPPGNGLSSLIELEAWWPSEEKIRPLGIEP
jgi:hypothetical protein